MSTVKSKQQITPLLPLSKFNNNQIYIKRDDLFPVSFGGNKARKALLFFDEIDAGNYDAVVTYGSSSSNHCRVVANLAASRNIPCYIVSPKEQSKSTFNSKMMHLCRAEITECSVSAVHNTIEAMIAELVKQTKKPYFIPGGGHGICGTHAYVQCYEEIMEFEKQNNIHFDYIFHASGTGTTQAGLICGQIIHSENRNIIGISIARKNPRGRQIVLDSVCEYLRYKDVPVTPDQIERNTCFVDEYTGKGYGKMNSDIDETIRTMFMSNGIPMDATYTAKAYCGMQQYLKEHQIKNTNILFIHTGGTPLFFDDLERMQ